MQKFTWVWVAIIISVILIVMQCLFGVKVTANEQGLPLLMVLLMNEFGFVLCAIGGWTAANVLKQTGMQAKLAMGIVICALFAIGFLWNLIRLYPNGGIGGAA